MSCPFKKYSKIFGIPNEGVHKYRLLDVALVDYVLTILLAIFLSKLTKIPLVISTIMMFVLGIILHMLFGINTSAVNYLGLAC
jgi:hypothetical protein